MTCPECNGAGFTRKRFLFFFRRRARCRLCGGTGSWQPSARELARYRRDQFDDDDSRPMFGTPGYSSSGGGAEAEDSFVVGSGGRSGGGGASASWGDPSGSAPVIVDPFAGEATAGAVGAAMAADAAGSDAASSGGDSESASASDSGTSY